MSRRRGDRIEVGGTYEVNSPSDPNHLVFVVLAECTAKTVRFKREEPGWRILMLSVGPWSDVAAGSVQEWVQGAAIFRDVKRLS